VATGAPGLSLAESEAYGIAQYVGAQLPACQSSRELAIEVALANLLWGSWTLGPWELHPLSLLFVASGTLMISKTLRIPKL
jgi:hypothetical protein